ncbi:hypothetical protein H1R20_g10399, partial [Candolleomyces eurysporus]
MLAFQVEMEKVKFNEMSSGIHPDSRPRQSITSHAASCLVLDHTYSTPRAPLTTNNVNAAKTYAFYAAKTYAFYAINAVHDIAYRYGFTEAAFNFQTLERVEVGTIGAQTSLQNGTPNRDGPLSNDIIVCEMTHGIIDRMIIGEACNPTL